MGELIVWIELSSEFCGAWEALRRRMEERIIYPRDAAAVADLVSRLEFESRLQVSKLIRFHEEVRREKT